MAKRGGTLVLAVLVTTGALVSGCGVPTDGPAIEIAIEQNDGSSGGDGSDTQPLPDTDPDLSLEKYLTAAAGIANTRGDRLNSFYVTPSTEFDQTQVVNIVDNVETTLLPHSENGELKYRVSYEIVGVYDQWGQLLPPDGKRDLHMDVRLLRDQPDGKWRLVERPSRLLLTAGAFKEYYVASPLYFQRKDALTLVPDIRYIYEEASKDRVREDLVKWLLDGPSEWMRTAVQTAFPTGSTLNKQPTVEDGDLVIDLGSDAVTGDEDRMAAQLAWTLWATADGLGLRLERNGQQVFESTFGAYLERNPTAVMGNVTGMSVHWLDGGAIAPVADRKFHSGIKNAKYVASSVSRQHMAIVDTSNRLTVYTTSVTKLGESVVTDAKVTGLPSGALGRPTWVGEGTLLLPVGDELVAVNERDDDWRAQSESLIGGVGRISAAPDGGRLALTVNGRAYVAPLAPQGDGTVELGVRRAVDRGRDNVFDVAWSEEHRLVLLNSGPKNFLRTATIDGVFTEQLKDRGTSFAPTSVAVLCDSPSDVRSPSTNVVVEVAGTLYQIDSTGLRPLRDSDGTPREGTAPFFYAPPP